MAALSRNPEAFADFLALLDELRVRELEKLMDRTVDAANQRGVVDGISIVRSAFTLNLSEEAQRARRDAR